MADTSNKFNIVGLDFDTIKANLKQYLQGQSVFSDYDFEGSGFSILLDLLSVNTHYLGYYLNMVANEIFLDSASQRNSLVSIAKELNYTPRSRKAATAIVNLEFIPNSVTPEASIIIPKFYKFATTIDGETFTFVTNEVHTVNLDQETNTYKVNNVVLKEGLGYINRQSFDPTNAYQKFIIPSAFVDTSELIVKVQAAPGNSATEVFTLADEVTVLNGQSLVYFLQEGDDQRYEVYFGDGIIGKALTQNNIVILEYIICSGDTPNKAETFVASQMLTGIESVTVTTVTPAYGGAERESVASIKFSATKNYESQRRAVTTQDYKTLLVQNYPNINSVAVWGGEDHDPPMYGKVYLSIKPSEGYYLTDVAKENIKQDILSSLNVVTVVPEIIDPDYIYVELSSIVKFDALRATSSENLMKAAVIATIQNYSDNNITAFNQVFRYTHLTRLIDLVDTCITNNLTTVKVQKRVTPLLNVSQDLTFNFTSSNPIQPGTISSSQFVVTSDPTYLLPYRLGDVFAFDDDGLGNLRVYKNVGLTKVVVKAKAGTIDYENGLITVSQFLPASITNNVLKVSAKPVYNDVTPVKNYLVTIDPLDVSVSMQVNPKVLA